MTDNFIPIWQFAKERGVSRQTVYRWIREHNISGDDLKTITKTVERLYINQNVSYEPKRKKRD